MIPEPAQSASAPKFQSDFINSSIEIIKAILNKDNGLPPLLLMAVEPSEERPERGICVAHFPTKLLESGKGKDELAAIIKEMLKSKPSDEVVFVTEAWSAKPNLPKDIEKMLLDYTIKPGQLPARFKEEIIMLQYYDLRSGKTVNHMGKIPFYRDTDGNVTHYDEPEWFEAKKSEGRFTNLME